MLKKGEGYKEKVRLNFYNYPYSISKRLVAIWKMTIFFSIEMLEEIVIATIDQFHTDILNSWPWLGNISS
jgi:hypothetical protein